MTFLYVFGPPASGKSTLIYHLTDGLTPEPQGGLVPHVVYTRDGNPVLVELGVRRGTFSGTDALAMNILPKAVDWVASQPYPHLIAEGDRLACDAFFLAVTRAGYRLRLWMLDGPDELLASRRRDRARGLGVAEQNEQWVKGRVTKARNLGVRWDAVRLDASCAPLSRALQALLTEEPS